MDREKTLKKKPSLSVIMPALNVAYAIEDAVKSSVRAIKDAGVEDFEIIIVVNTKLDGSHDGTPDLAEKLALEYSSVKAVNNYCFKEFGETYRQGVEVSQKDYIMMIPSDNETVEESVRDIISNLGTADLIIPYTTNKEVRKFKRRVVSQGFTTFCNTLFNLRLRYYNGICIIRRDFLESVPMSSNNFAYMAEILVYLLKSGAEYKEVPMLITATTASEAFKLKRVFEALDTLLRLFWRVNIKKERVDINKTAV